MRLNFIILTLITCFFSVISSYAYSSNILNVNEYKIPVLNEDIFKHKHLVSKIYKHLHKSCIEEFGNNVGFNYDINKNTYQLILSKDNHKGLVVYALYECNRKIMCGSGGCDYFIISDNKMVSGFGHRPYSEQLMNGDYVIMLPFSGGSCERSDGKETYSADFCASIAFWDKIHNSFISYGNILKEFH